MDRKKLKKELLIMSIVVITIFIIFTTVISFAGSPVTTAVDPIDIINQGSNVINAIATKSVKIGTGAGMIAYFFMNLLKMKTNNKGGTLADDVIPKRYRPLVTALIGAGIGIVGTLLTGGTLPLAISVSVASGALPTLIHEIFDTTIKDGKK
jgi:hypothetical protein